ncbi:MAG: hypothetical protein M1459_01795 [Patescibacteria group bacterium]|nr:hypothetical protein [Patescibacteria group bacterium]
MSGNKSKIRGILFITAIIITAIASVKSTYAANAYDFGGIYTLAASCPSGYTAQQFKYGSIGFTSDLYYCYRDASASGGTEYEFGGAYIGKSDNGGAEVNVYPNPITGSASCPAGYTTTTYGSSATTWNPVYYFHSCTKDVSAVDDSLRLQNDFGGIYGVYTCDPQSTSITDINTFCKNSSGVSDSSSVGDTNGTYAGTHNGKSYVNPMTMGYSCPSGYKSSSVWWLRTDSKTLNSAEEKPNKDWIMNICYNDLAVTSTCVDIGLRVQQTGGPVGLCAESGTVTSALRIRKNGITYGLTLVDPSDADATSVIIRLASGVIKAVKKYVP